MYKIYTDIEKSNCLLRVIDNTWIPMEEINPNYQEYLKWLEEGNTPEEIIDEGDIIE